MNTFDSFIEAFLLNQSVTTRVGQFHRGADFKKLKTYFIEKNIAFSNTITSQRVLKKDGRITSEPYGYKKSED